MQVLSLTETLLVMASSQYLAAILFVQGCTWKSGTTVENALFYSILSFWLLLQHWICTVDAQ